MTAQPLADRAAAPCRQQWGVTLIEACTVLAVTAVLASLAVAGMQTLIDSRRLEGTASQLAADIHWVRTEAVARNERLRLSFHTRPSGSCYVIHTGAAADCNCSAPGPATCRGAARQIKTVSVADTDRVRLEPEVDSVAFDPLHGTNTPAATLRVVSLAGRSIHHVVNIMGRVRSCSPQAVQPGYRAC